MRVWSRLLVQNSDLRQWCSRRCHSLSLASCPYHPPPRRRSFLIHNHYCSLADSQAMSHEAWHVGLSHTIIVRVCNSSEQEKSCHRKWAVGLKLRHFASVIQDTLYSLAWGKDGREGIRLGGWLTGLGDSVQRQQHSQKRCVLDMCVCVHARHFYNIVSVASGHKT